MPPLGVSNFEGLGKFPKIVLTTCVRRVIMVFTVGPKVDRLGTLTTG